MRVTDAPGVPFSTFTRDRVRTAQPRLVSALARVATSPPLVTYSSGGAATTISGPVESLVTSSQILRTGAQAFTNLASQDLNGNFFITGQQVAVEFPVWAFSFITDAPRVDLVYLGSAAPSYRLLVDGEAVTQNAATASGGSGNQHRLLITFPSRKFRQVTVECASLFLSTVTVGPTDTIFAAPRKPFTFGFMGDSITANGGVDGIAPTAAKILGSEWLVNGSGGTGYLNSQGGAGGKQVFIDRLPGLLAADPDYLVTMGGINDGSGAPLAAAVGAYLDLALESLPPQNVIVLGPWDPPSQNHATSQAKRDTIFTEASARGCLTIDNVAESWTTGTGSVSAPAGDGNADNYGNADRTHQVSPDGYTYLGMRVGIALADLLAV